MVIPGVYYRKSNNDSWTEIVSNTATGIAISAGEKVQLRGFTTPTETDSNKSYTNYWRFDFSNKVKLSGNVMSLANFADVCTSYCFDRIFSDNSTILQAPRLPALKLAKCCYREMFAGCTGLVEAPELPAAELAKDCYSGMFKDCTNLNKVKVNFTEWDSTDNNTWDWLKNTAANGTFTKPAALPEVFGEHNIPQNWQVVNI